MPDELPYFASDPSKVTVRCQERFKTPAHHAHENVPIWRERVAIGSYNATNGSVECAPAAPAQQSAPEPASADASDEVVHVEDVLLDAPGPEDDGD